MKEIISLHIGQAGCQIGQSCWELFCLQHNIQPNGTKPQPLNPNEDNSNTFFSQTQSNKYIPRSVFMDLQPSVIDTIRTGKHSQLFRPNSLISGKQDAANIYSRGYYTIGRQILENSIQQIRKQVEKCEALQGFLYYNSIVGGTGSGFTSLLMQNIKTEFGKTPKIGLSLYPSPQFCTSVVQPYNAILNMSALNSYCDLNIIFDNQAMFQICKRNLKIQKPSYTNINRIVAQAVSSITAPLRFPGELNFDLSELLTSLVPFPRLHYGLPAYTPMVAQEEAYKQMLSVSDITKMAFKASSQLAKCNPTHGRFMACGMMYRGDVVAQDMCKALAQIKTDQNLMFMRWTPSQFKCSINRKSPTQVAGGDLANVMRALCMVSNSSAIAEIFSRIDHKFDLMLFKRAFVWWYVGEGMEEGEFSEAREDISNLEKHYDGFWFGLEEAVGEHEGGGE